MIDPQQHAPASQAAAQSSSAPVRQIIASVATAFGLTPADLVGKGRRAEIVQARYAAIHAVRQAKPHFSLSQIGSAFGDRDHSTIFHALRKVEREGVPQSPAALTGAPSKGSAA